MADALILTLLTVLIMSPGFCGMYALHSVSKRREAEIDRLTALVEKQESEKAEFLLAVSSLVDYADAIAAYLLRDEAQREMYCHTAVVKMMQGGKSFSDAKSTAKMAWGVNTPRPTQQEGE